MNTTDVSALTAALAEPFEPSEIGWKPQATSKDGNKALAIAYIDARNVMDRLDAVVGAANWQDAYTPLPNGNVVCRLSLRLGGEWVTKEDVGGESDQKDAGDREKAAFSDALKRAAVKWAIGRYLYSLDGQWVEYDSQRKQLKGTPKLPAWALPKSKASNGAPAEKRPDPTPSRPSGPTSASISTPNEPGALAGDAPEPPDEQTIAEIEHLIINHGLNRETFDSRLVQVYGTASLRGLTAAEAKEVAAKLNAAPKKPKKAPAGAA